MLNTILYLTLWFAPADEKSVPPPSIPTEQREEFFQAQLEYNQTQAALEKAQEKLNNSIKAMMGTCGQFPLINNQKTRKPECGPKVESEKKETGK